MSRHADGKTHLETECLSVPPWSFEIVNSIFGMSDSGKLPKHSVDKLCLSHERLRAELDGALSIIAEMESVETLHRRKCWACKTTNWHADSMTPYVLCPKCGSQDTRRLA